MDNSTTSKIMTSIPFTNLLLSMGCSWRVLSLVGKMLTENVASKDHNVGKRSSNLNFSPLLTFLLSASHWPSTSLLQSREMTKDPWNKKQTCFVERRPHYRFKRPASNHLAGSAASRSGSVWRTQEIDISDG